MERELQHFADRGRLQQPGPPHHLQLESVEAEIIRPALQRDSQYIYGRPVRPANHHGGGQHDHAPVAARGDLLRCDPRAIGTVHIELPGEQEWAVRGGVPGQLGVDIRQEECEECGKEGADR